MTSESNNHIPGNNEEWTPWLLTAKWLSDFDKIQEKKLPTWEYQKWLFENIRKLSANEFNKLDKKILWKLAPEQVKAMILEWENKIALNEIHHQEENLKKLQRFEIADRNIASFTINMEGCKRNIARLKSEKMDWDLFTNYNESLDAMVDIEMAMIEEYERAIAANKYYKYDEKYANLISINKKIWDKRLQKANSLIDQTKIQAENGAIVAKSVHGIAKDIAKGIVAIETWWNPVAVGATGAAFDTMLWLGEMATGEKTGTEVILQAGTSFTSDTLGGSLWKLPYIKTLTDDLSKKIGKYLAQIIVQKIASSIIKSGVKTWGQLIKFSEVWDQVEKELPKDMTSAEREKLKDSLQSEMWADLAWFAKKSGIEFTKSLVPWWKGVTEVIIWGTTKFIISKST